MFEFILRYSDTTVVHRDRARGCVMMVKVSANYLISKLHVHAHSTQVKAAVCRCIKFRKMCS